MFKWMIVGRFLQLKSKKYMKKILLLLFVLLPTALYSQSIGKIISNVSSNSTLSVDTVNCNSKLNLLQTSSSITITIPNITAGPCGVVLRGITEYVSNIGSASVSISITGHSAFSIAPGEQAILSWVGSKWIVLYIGSGGGGGSFLPLAGGTVLDSASNKSFSSVARTFYYSSGMSFLDFSGGSTPIIRDQNNKIIGYLQNRLWFDSNEKNSFNFDTRNFFKSSDGINSVLDYENQKLNGSWTTTDTFKIGNNINSFVGQFFTNSLSANRKYTLPNNTGTIALLSDIPTLTASNGLTRSTNDFQLGGTLGSNTTINGSGSRSLTLGGVGSKLTDLLSNAANSVYLKAANAGGSLLLQASTSGIYHTDFSGVNATIESNQNQTFLNWANSTYSRTFSLDTNGIGLETTGNNHTGYFKSSRLTTVNRLYQLPDSSGTIALAESLTKYLPLTLGVNATVALGSHNLNFTKSGNTVYQVGNGTFFDGSTVESADLFNRFLYDNIGAPVLTWGNSSTSGIGITKVGNNTFIGYFKNSNLSSDQTYQVPNISGTLVVGANNLSVFASTTSSQLAGVLSDESGSGLVAYTTSPVFTTPNIGIATGSVSGNAGTATALQTPRTINGVSFDGSANITIPNVVTVASDGTDADYTAIVNSVKYLPSATLSTNRTITIPTGSNGDFLEIYNNEVGFNWLLTGASIYLADGSTIITSLYANTNHLIRKVSGKWRILN